ncbi:MAG: ABC transporter ATP-binding protein [Candidatus Edwardsbacteria bacterium]|jgi:NitT/TauT family transport system ATP-binding protein|nr:ABC transporter ATP-binding protein [Candidatus Edwardsbacteria bacterium]
MSEQRGHPPVIEFRDVAKVFNPGTPRAFTALEHLSFLIDDLPEKGEFRAILGPSGCGKSTALNLLSGFQEVFPPTSGEVRVRGCPVCGPGIDRGMVFQKYSSFPMYTVFGNVKFGLELNRGTLGYDQRRIDSLAMEWIERVGLGGHQHKYPHQLSGGQQQRVALARTLVLRPRIILMDEPFSALDEPTRLEMQRLLVDLWGEVQATVLIVTHSITEAVYIGDRVWIFSRAPGRIAREFSDLPVPQPGVHPLEIQRTAEFLERVEEVSEAFRQVERGEER